MRAIFTNKYFCTVVRIFLGAVFVYASMDKISNPGAFAGIIKNYHILPVQLVNLLAIFLPWLEFYTGLFLIIQKWVRASLLIYSGLMVIFVVALSQALIRGLDISCGCFSVQSAESSRIWLRIAEDILLLFLSINLFRFSDDIENVKNIIQNI